MDYQEAIDVLKGQRNLARLVRKQTTDKRGRRTTVWVRPDKDTGLSDKVSDERITAFVNRARQLPNHKLQEYIDLAKISLKEAREKHDIQAEERASLALGILNLGKKLKTYKSGKFSKKAIANIVRIQGRSARVVSSPVEKLYEDEGKLLHSYAKLKLGNLRIPGKSMSLTYNAKRNMPVLNVTDKKSGETRKFHIQSVSDLQSKVKKLKYEQKGKLFKPLEEKKVEEPKQKLIPFFQNITDKIRMVG